ncbi:STEROL DESATURASE [Salix koriyanagi]|uniref:STEROL DESATURASE n=1 Tax=Salix koriyanagi TaxID=2511006 RepID=A0A9Q0X4K5_9ROSI|nr:STEROL DESATURASE [Salix koriyanagi]
MASIIESGWLYLITHFSDFQLACLGSFFLHESVFFLSGLPFIYLERAGWLKKYKIQMKNNTLEAQEKCITRLLLYHFGVNLPVMLASYPVFRHMGMQSSLPFPSWKVILMQIAFYFILEDFIFYWGHRVLHTKWLYKHVHSIHHEYATPFGLTSEYAHPAEILFLGFATIVGPAITGPHLVTLWLWMVLRVLETVEAHCGYHFPMEPLQLFYLCMEVLIFTTTITACCILNLETTHPLSFTWTGEFDPPQNIIISAVLEMCLSSFCTNKRAILSAFCNYGHSLVLHLDLDISAVVFGTDKGYRKLQALKNAGVESAGKQT